MSFLFLVGYMLLFGLRDSSVGPDTETYILLYDKILEIDLTVLLLEYDIFFIFFLKFFRLFFDDPKVCFSLISLVYVWGILRLYKKIYPNKHTLAIFFLISSFFFYTLGFNVVRHSISVVFWAWAIYYYSNNRKIISIILLFIAFNFHFTALFVMFCLMLISVIKKLKYFLFIYIIAFCIAVSGINIFASFGFIEETFLLFKKLNTYVNSGAEYKVGVRLDFIFFNTFFLTVALYNYYILYNRTVVYENFLKYYITMSAIFFLSFHIPYSDRIGIQSWFVIPIILVLGKDEGKISSAQRFYTLVIGLVLSIYTFTSIKSIFQY